MFAAQLVGMFGGCFLAPATFQMFVAGQPDLGQPGSTYPAPFAQVYRNMAVVGVGGASELGDNCLYVRAATCAAPVTCLVDCSPSTSKALAESSLLAFETMMSLMSALQQVGNHAWWAFAVSSHLSCMLNC